MIRAGLSKSLGVKPLRRLTSAVIDRSSIHANPSDSLGTRNAHWETPKEVGVPKVEAPV